MSIEEDVGKFAASLEQRNKDYERRLEFTHSEDRWVLLKAEAAELFVIQAKFNEVVGKHITSPITSELGA